MRTHIAHSHFPAIPLAVPALFLSLSAAVSAASEWKTYRDAEAAFKTGDAAVRAEAFAWMRAHLGEVPHWEISQALKVHDAMLATEAPNTDFATVFQEIAPGHTDEWRVSLAIAIIDVLAKRNEPNKAQAFVNDLLGQSQDMAAYHRSRLIARRANLLAGPLGKPRDADGFLVAERSSLPEDAVSAVAKLDVTRGVVLADYLNDAKQAEDLWRCVIALGPAVHEHDFAMAADRLSALLQDKGDTTGAVDVLLALPAHPAMPPAWFAGRLRALSPGPDIILNAVDALRRRMAVVPKDERIYRLEAERIQPQVIDLLLSVGRPEEALSECRVALHLVPDNVYESIVFTSARTFKKADANLGRANAMLSFASEDGPTPSTRNPLLSVPAAGDPVRIAFAAELSALPDSPSWREHLSRSLSWLWLDRPDEAMRSAIRALAICPLDEKALKQCAAAVTRPFLVATRDEAAVQTLLDYLLLGAAGADGIPGSLDDLPDPLPAMTVRITPPAKTE